MAAVDFSVRAKAFRRKAFTGCVALVLLFVARTVIQESVQPAIAASRECPPVNRPASTTFISDVAVGTRSGTVAVGWVPDGQKGLRGAAWIASGGRISGPAPLPRLGDQADQAMLSVTTYGGALVAVGRQNGRASAWISGNGMEWTPVSGLEKHRGTTSAMRAVSHDKNLVVAGWICEKPNEGRKPAIWTSSDTTHWKLSQIQTFSRLLDVEEKRPQAQINSVQSFEGHLYAVGVVSAKPTELRRNRVNWEAAVWRSRDLTGEKWDPVEDVGGATGDGDQFMNGVTTWSGGLVAVGGDGFGRDTTAAVWTSRDGTSWQRVPDDVTPLNPLRRLGESSAMTSVATIGDMIVAVGYSERFGGAKSPTTWMTRDPQHWQQPETSSAQGEATSIVRQANAAGVEVGWTLPRSRRGPAVGWSKILTLPRA